jgi:hypothetical protein
MTGGNIRTIRGEKVEASKRNTLRKVETAIPTPGGAV